MDSSLHQAPPSMGFSRQEYWSGLPFPSPGNLPNPGIEPRSPALQADALTSEPPRKPHDQPRQHIKKQRHYFANKGPSSQGYGFSSGYESWTIKKAERRRTDAFELWCWRRLLRAPWTARRSNQSILMEISPEYSLEGLMWSWNSNTLAIWCKELSHCKRPWCWERLRAGGEKDDRGWDSWMASPAPQTWVWVHSRSWWWTGRSGVLQSMGSQRIRHNSTTELNWTFRGKEKQSPTVICWEIYFVSSRRY